MIDNQLGSGSRADPTGALATPYLDVVQAVSAGRRATTGSPPQVRAALFFRGDVPTSTMAASVLDVTAIEGTGNDASTDWRRHEASTEA